MCIFERRAEANVILWSSLWRMRVYAGLLSLMSGEDARGTAFSCDAVIAMPSAHRHPRILAECR